MVKKIVDVIGEKIYGINGYHIKKDLDVKNHAMNRITAEEAKQFVPLKNDMKSDLSDAAYYTFTPSDRGEDWEDVTYYLPRRKRMYEGRKGDGDSWVYILSNESQPGMYKIGYTSHEDVDKRVKQFSTRMGISLF
jgi:hypothetical protein